MIDLREKIIVLAALAAVLVVVALNQRARRLEREQEFRAAWQTIGDYLWEGVRRGS